MAHKGESPLPFWIEVATASMSPAITPGDWVAIKHDDCYDVGDIVLIRKEYYLLLHRIIKVLPPEYVLTQGDANPYPDAPIPLADIVGRVTAIRKPQGWASFKQRLRHHKENVKARLSLMMPYAALYQVLIAPFLRHLLASSIQYETAETFPEEIRGWWPFFAPGPDDRFFAAYRQQMCIGVLAIREGATPVYLNVRVRYRGLGIGQRLAEMAGQTLDDGHLPVHLQQLARLEFGLQEGEMKEKDSDFSIFVPVRVLAFLWAAGMLALMFAAGYGAILGASTDPHVIGVAALIGAALLLLAPAVWLAMTW